MEVPNESNVWEKLVKTIHGGFDALCKPEKEESYLLTMEAPPKYQQRQPRTGTLANLC